MTVNDLLAGGLQQSLGMLKAHVGDLTDAELLTHPVPGANHANWQLGHLILSESQMMSASGATMPPLPAGFAESYSKDNVKSDDPGKFATKAVLLEALEKTRAASVAFAKSVSAEKLAAASNILPMCPTVCDLIALGPVHDSMHIGQVQVLRRKLGKALLF
jgi:hypothetical protein